jgi:hypothetical protein
MGHTSYREKVKPMRRGATALDGSAPPSRRRPIIALAAVVVAGGLLAGCATGPSQVGAAAIVGETVIPLESIQSWFDRVVADRERKERARAAGQLDDIGRRIVTEAVRHELLRQAAERERLRINEERVTDLLDELGGPAKAIEELAGTPGTEWLLYDETTIRDRVRDQLIALELGREYYDSTSIGFHATQAESRAQALDKANKIAGDPDQVGEIIKADLDNGVQAFPDQELTVSTDPSTAAQSPLFAVPAGTIMVYPAGAQGGWWVIFIAERDTDAPPNTSSQAVSEGSVTQPLMAEIGLRMLPPLMADLNIKLNPRYGVWEPVSLEAAPNDGERQVTTISVRQPSN